MIGLLLIAGLASAADLRNGAYLTHAASCAECHSTDIDHPFAGGLRLPTPFGTFVTPNISPDPQTGIGQWTAADLRQALRWGISPSGFYYFPSFPYRSFTKMTDQDMDDIYAYLMTQPPIRQVNPPHELKFAFDHRWLVFFWQELFLRGHSSSPEEDVKVGTGPFRPLAKRSDKWNRGAYLVEAVLHCAECHSPRNLMGAPEASRWLSGSDIEFSGRTPPNITPDPLSGRPWSVEQWRRFLTSGFDPRDQTPGVEMALVIRATAGLTPQDVEAVIEYLRAQQPIRTAGGGK